MPRAQELPPRRQRTFQIIAQPDASVLGEITTEDFGGLDPEKTIAVLPVAAIEQHGPHLAVSIDTTIADRAW